MCCQCSCRHLHLRKFCFRQIYWLLSREPCKSEFLTGCYKSYDIKYDNDVEYTGKVSKLQNIVKQCKGICTRGSINKWGLAGLPLEENVISFTGTPHQSVDINLKSTIALVANQKSILFLNTAGKMLNVKMSAGALSKLQSYPLVNMAK